MTPSGILYIVGIGPGDPRHMTGAALEALHDAEHIVGYKTYIALITPLLKHQQVSGFAMRKEVDRVLLALNLARAGHRVALVCSGDAGLYGMAGLCFEVARSQGLTQKELPTFTVVPGVTSTFSAASLVGAPLMHDTALISLSDLLTPWSLIKRRIEAAASSDFVISFYNPASHKRKTQLHEAIAIVKEHRSGSTPVALVSNAYRENEQSLVTDLDGILDHEIGMSSSIIIGNSQTYLYEGFMVTPRGYQEKYALNPPESSPV